MVDKQPHMHHELGIAAGAKPFKSVLKNSATDDIGEGNGTYKQECPPPAFPSEIDRDEQ